MLTPTENITIIHSSHSNWDFIVKSFPDYDVYYLSGYVKSFKIHGDGEPYLIHYHTKDLEVIYVFFLRETSKTGWFDLISPYGYGGPLFKGNTSSSMIYSFYEEWSAFAKQNFIIDNFIRFNPVVQNDKICRTIMDVVDLGTTIVMKLDSEDVIWSNISSKNRNMIRKAMKNNVEIYHGKGMSLLDHFIELYNKTMDHDNASQYYYFKREFYESIDRDLNNNYEIFYATYNNIIVSMAIIIFANDRMHYHLSCSSLEYRHVAPSNLLLYKAAIWGQQKGMKTFHLGGGLGSDRDNLYKFKEGFNRYGQCPFSIGKEIFDKEIYDILVNMRMKNDDNFDLNSSFFPLYKSKQ